MFYLFEHDTKQITKQTKVQMLKGTATFPNSLFVKIIAFFRELNQHYNKDTRGSF